MVPRPSSPEAATGPSSLHALLRALEGSGDGPAALLPAGGGDWSVEASTATIFVSIVSYRDSELPRTVQSLLRTALRRDRIFLGVVNQLSCEDAACQLSAADVSDCCFLDPAAAAAAEESFFDRHVRTLTLPHTEARGPVYARSLAAGLHRGERFVLQVDSHMRFRPHWDAYLIDTLEAARAGEGCPRPVLTTYPQGYQLPDLVPCDTRPTLLVHTVPAANISSFVTDGVAPIRLTVCIGDCLLCAQMPSHFDEEGFLRQDGKILEPVPGECSAPLQALRYLRSPLWAAGFSFSDASLLSEVPASPFLPHLFFGEEQSMAARYLCTCTALNLPFLCAIPADLSQSQALHARLRLLCALRDRALPPLQPRAPAHVAAGRGQEPE